MNVFELQHVAFVWGGATLCLHLACVAAPALSCTAIKSFPRNIETKVMVTYKLEQPRGDGPEQRPSPRPFPGSVRRDPTQSGVTVLLHHSMIKLPEEPMRPRIRDERVGFFSPFNL